jgi:error-prone DNA polymerase
MADRLEDRTAELGRLSDDHAPVIQFSGADEIVRPQHPRNLRVLPGSRDFH